MVQRRLKTLKEGKNYTNVVHFKNFGRWLYLIRYKLLRRVSRIYTKYTSRVWRKRRICSNMYCIGRELNYELYKLQGLWAARGGHSFLHKRKNLETYTVHILK